MESFCGSRFWDISLTWNTDNPDFTPCFQKTVLVWVPCAFLWLFMPLEAYHLLNSTKPSLPWNWINVIKVIIVTVLCGLSMAEMGYSLGLYLNDRLIFPVNYYTPFIKLATFMLALILMLLQRKRGIHTSGVFYIFWLLVSLGDAVTYRSLLLKTFDEDILHVEDEFTYITTMIYFPLVLASFLLSSFSDYRAPKKRHEKKPHNPCPELFASFLSLITFWWFNPMAALGFKQPLVQADMWELSETNQTKVLASKFDRHWKKAEKSVNVKVALISSRDLTKRQKELSKLSVLCPLMKTFWVDLLLAGIMKFISSVLTFVNPLVLDMLIAFITNDEPYWRGFFYAGLMFFSSMAESIFNSQHEFRMYVIGMKMRSCLISAIYRKSLVLSSAARRTFTVGEIVNLMSVDTQRVMDYVQIWNLLWSAPLQMIIALYLLWSQLGIATLGGLAVMILMFPLNAYVTAKMRMAQVSLMKAKDKRIKLMNEILNGIKILKLYAWEKSFLEYIQSIRSIEVKDLRLQAYLSGAITIAFTSAPFLVALASFAMYVLISPENILDPNRAFVSLSLFNILRVPLALLPMLISFGAMFFVSLGRINKYLQGSELDEGAVTHEDYEEPIVMEEASFSWTKDDLPTLRNLSFQVEKGSLVAVVGSVGAGKSSFLSALLGDMERVGGRANISGSIAYVPQQAWIQNATLRSNILFVNPYDEVKYNQVLEACALTPDLKVLAGGDMTEIGEKGINLSGGQKQRVSLARAVYSDADVILLDDPLSAVDSHVGKHIFENVIGPKSILKHKTRILVTHRIAVLPEVDSIIVMKDGTITEMGSYAELLARRGDFADFLLQFLTQASNEEEVISPEELHLMEEIVAVVGPTPELKRHLSKLSSAESDGHISESEAQQRARTMSLHSPNLIGDGVCKRTASTCDKDIKVEPVAKKRMTKLTDTETAEVGSVKWKVYFDYLRAVGLMGALLTVFTYVASHAFTVASSIWLSDWSNDGLDPIKAYDPAQRDLRLGVYGALGAGETLFVLIGSLSLNLAALRGSKLLHNEMLKHILHAPMSFFDTTPLGRILNRFSKDVDTTDITIRFNLRMLLVQFFRTIVAFILISFETPIFLVAVLPLGILYYIVQKFYIATSRQLKRIESITRSPIYTNFSETVAGVTSIRAYGAANDFVNKSNRLVDVNHTSYFPSLAASRWLAIRLEFLGYSIVFLAALFAVLTRESLSPGIVGLSVSYALTVTATLNMLVRASADVETNIVSVERCLEYTHTPIEAPWSIQETKPAKDWPSDGHIYFDHYSTRYREGLDLVLKNITCDIRPGEKVGIVGRTGAGKSSLTLSLFRLIEPADGAIVIDEVDVTKIGLHDLRSKITIIPQDPVLFTGTLRMNLDPFDKYSDEEVWTALDQAHLKSYVVTLDAGLQHEVSEGGENLSLGQRQLVCLARALLRKSKVLVLDEATAAIDLETDELIQTTIRKEFADCTIITIAHRLNTIMDYDRVMVMDKGSIAEFDSPSSLLQNQQSIFYSMAKDAGLV